MKENKLLDMNSPSRTYSIAVSGVPGFRTTPALAPKPFIWVIRKNIVKKVQVGTLKLGKNLQIRFVIPTPTSLSLSPSPGRAMKQTS